MMIRQFKQEDEKQLVQLWNDCKLVVPWNNPHRDIQRKVKIQPELFLVGIHENRLVASVMGGYDGHRGWVYYLAVHPDYQQKGFARRMMLEIENRLHKLGCPKINLQVRNTNLKVIEFYKRIGYKLDDVVSFGKRLDPDI
jgi:ribosomal protein S18 acetylase RimI-like enzyme